MDLMKSISDIESGPTVPPRDVPNTKISIGAIDGLPFPTKKSLPKKVKKPKKVKAVVETPVKPVELDMFSSIGNTDKMASDTVTEKKVKKKKKKKSVSSLGSMSSNSSMGGFSMDSDSSGKSSIDSNMSGSSYADREQFTKERRKEEIMQEKIEMLTRISKMSKDGFTTAKKWKLTDDMDEIRFECYRMTRESNSQKAVKKMQHILISVATMIEFANGMVNPFNLKLQGFSQNMMLTVSDYDDSLEELHHKWSGRTSFGPEMTIMMTFVSSAIFQHAGNVASTPAQPAAAKAAPGKDMSSMLGMFSSMMPKPKPKPIPVPVATPTATVETPTESDTPVTPKKRRSMKGPSANILENLTPSMTV